MKLKCHSEKDRKQEDGQDEVCERARKRDNRAGANAQLSIWLTERSLLDFTDISRHLAFANEFYEPAKRDPIDPPSCVVPVRGFGDRAAKADGERLYGSTIKSTCPVMPEFVNTHDDPKQKCQADEKNRALRQNLRLAVRSCVWLCTSSRSAPVSRLASASIAMTASKLSQS